MQKILSVAGEQSTCHRPSRRRVNGRAVRERDVVRKLALRRKVFRNVLVERGVALEFEACRFVWIENGNRLLHPIANCLYRRGKVGITRDKCESVGGIGHGIHHHLGCDVDVERFSSS